MNTTITGDKSWVNEYDPETKCFSLQWKSDENTKHYLTQMLVAINWRYWQAEKNPGIRMMVQGRLMQARFIEVHQVYAKKRRILF